MENPFAPKFLSEKQPDLHASQEVESAVRRAKGLGKEVPSQKDKPGKVQTYLDRIEEIFTKGSPEQIEQRIGFFKDKLHEQVIVKSEDVPDSYFAFQQRIAREQGHGDVEITPSMRRHMIDTIIRDQEDTFDAWVDYMATPDATYPTWYKYWVIRNVSRLGSYDKEKHAFKKRRKDTVDRFPDIDREAIAYVYDALDVHLKKQGKITSEVDRLDEDPEWQRLLKDANFGKLYAYAIEKVTPADQELKETIEGEWVTYEQGTDHMPLVKSLQGHGTGWCTAGEQTARHQLNAGDFHVFYTKDKHGQYSTPRIAIRMEGDSIAEVRGIDARQELEPKLVDIARAKFSELPGGDKYEKKSSDMKHLTTIEAKTNKSEDLTRDDLRFLYEFDAPIEGFGYEPDPRIDQLRDQRDFRADLRTLFNCTEEELQEKEHVRLKNIPKWKELPADLKEQFKLDSVWEGEYRAGRPMEDFEVQNTTEAEPIAKVFDIADVIRKKQQEDPTHQNYLTTAEVFEAIDEAGYRPATLEELVTYGRDYWKPDADPKTLTEEERVLQNAQAPGIYGLNSVFSDADGSRLAPYLCWHGNGRKLRAYFLGIDWSAGHRFLVLRKVST